MKTSRKTPAVTIGTDPELFAYDAKKGMFVSVHDLLPGTKYSPCKVPRGAVQVDGVAAEFNILPAQTEAVFLRSLDSVKNTMSKIIQQKNPDIVLLAQPTAHFNPEYWSTLPPSALALGCEPDYNAYTRKANPKPETTKPFRTGSGHVHIGIEGIDQNADDYVDFVCDLVKELDFVLYRQSLKWDMDEERMELYGQPGAFRFKPYGLEYRVLSNKWLARKETASFVFRAAKATTKLFLAGQRLAADFKESDKTYENFLSHRKVPIYEG